MELHKLWNDHKYPDRKRRGESHEKSFSPKIRGSLSPNKEQKATAITINRKLLNVENEDKKTSPSRRHPQSAVHRTGKQAK